jgi:hypothetical protein
MNMKILTNLDLVKNQLLNCVIQKVAVDPTTKLAAGWIIFNTDEAKLKYYNGEEWVTIGSEGGDSVDIATVIDSTSTNSKAAGAKAVYDFVIENLADIRAVANGDALIVDSTTGEIIGISVDTTVTEDSVNLITSGAVFTALQEAVSTVDAMKFKGTLSADGTITSTDTSINNKKLTALTDIKNGWTFKAAAAIDADVLDIDDKPIEVGDMVIACGNMATYDATKFSVIQMNLDGVVIGPVSSNDETVVVFNGVTGKAVKASTVTKTQLEALFTSLISLQATSAATDVVLSSSNTSDPTTVKPRQTIQATLKTTGITANTYGDNSANTTGTVDDQDSFTIPQFTVDAKGRMTAAEDKVITLNLASKGNIYRKSNPAITADANNNCSWVIDDITLEANQYPSVNLYEVNTGEMVLADVSVDFTDEEITIIFRNTGDISPDSYVAVIVI